MDSVNNKEHPEDLKASKKVMEENIEDLQRKSPKTLEDMMLLDVMKQQVETLDYFISRDEKKAKPSLKSKLLNLIKNAKEKIR